jgi:hypothetical protein
MVVVTPPGKDYVKYAEIFIKWDGLWCPCCGYRLNLKYKAKLRARKEIAKSRLAPRSFPSLKVAVADLKSDVITYV